VEAKLAKIWAKVLGLDEIGARDDFFESGGHSLLAIQVVSRIRQALQVELPLRTIFEKPTIAGLVESIETINRTERDQAPLPLSVSRSNTLPLSFAQERLWFLDQLASGAFNSYSATHLGGRLDAATLEQSLNEIVRRHESLRTDYRIADGQLVQAVNQPKPVSLPVVDLRGLSRDERETEALRLITEHSQTPFEPDRDSLFRCTLLRLDVEDHVFLLVGHPTIFDEWSMGVFLRDLAELYRDPVEGRSSRLAELQYADFAVWQRQHVAAEARRDHLPYWKQRLGGDLPVLEIPTDYPRLATRTPQRARQSLALPENLYSELKALSCREGATLFMFLMAAFQVLLHRYTGQGDIVVGFPTANRNRVEFEGLIGRFANTLLLRTELSGDVSFRRLLDRVRSTALEAYAHQDLPFEVMAKELEIAPGHERPFQVMLAPQKARFLQLSGLVARHIASHSVPAQFDLILYAMETEQGLILTLEYNADLFDCGTIVRMLGHFNSLLEGIMANPNACVSTLPILSEAERQQMIEWNDTQVDYPKGCLHEFFEARIEQNPDNIAVVCEDKQLTYRALNQRANQLAHYLRTRGVGPETTVGFYVEHSVEMAVGLLGILKAGGACLSLNPALPEKRLAFMLKDAGASVLLTQSRVVDDFPQREVDQVICLDLVWETILTESKENVASGALADHAAFISYTSGSTGDPKGAILPHGSESIWHLPETAPYKLSQTDTFLQIAHHAMGDMFWPWFNGARAVIASDRGYKDSAYLADLITEEHITVAGFVPTMLHMLLEEEKLGSCTCLRLVGCGGEPLLINAQERFFVRLEAELYNEYGLTEAGSIVWHCKRGETWNNNQRFVPIGHPTANTRVYLLDSYLQPVPIGVPGEICIGGEQLARGYLNAPGLTAEKFLPDPFNYEPGMLLYRTGDLARYLPDGSIDFLGRLDHQTKIRGFRVEPGEIEIVLSQHPAVYEAAVLARDDLPGDRCLVAYYVSAQEHAPTSRDLRRFLREKLPEYMVPSAFVMLDALPLTPNGKVNRLQLPVPDLGRPGEEPLVAPRTATERVIAGIWTKALGIERVGIYDDFFELGGHSLLAMQVVSRLRDIFRVEMPLHTMFEKPTIDGSVGAVTQLWGGAEVVEEIAQTLMELERLSEDEVMVMLQQISEDTDDE
jgi:amino acid adenylation domain-containing protein